MRYYIIVHDKETYDEILHIMSQPDKNYDIIYLDGRIRANGLGVTYIMPEFDRLNSIPIHPYIDTVYTSDELIVPQRYIIATYRGKQGYSVKYIEELEI